MGVHRNVTHAGVHFLHSPSAVPLESIANFRHASLLLTHSDHNNWRHSVLICSPGLGIHIPQCPAWAWYIPCSQAGLPCTLWVVLSWGMALIWFMKRAWQKTEPAMAGAFVLWGSGGPTGLIWSGPSHDTRGWGRFMTGMAWGSGDRVVWWPGGAVVSGRSSYVVNAKQGSKVGSVWNDRTHGEDQQHFMIILGNFDTFIHNCVWSFNLTCWKTSLVFFKQCQKSVIKVPVKLVNIQRAFSGQWEVICIFTTPATLYRLIYMWFPTV